MSDIHRLPLLGHDMPYYSVNEELEEHPKVFANRSVTGQQYWWWSRPTVSGRAVYGPFMTPADANKEAEEWVREQASKAHAAHSA